MIKFVPALLFWLLLITACSKKSDPVVPVVGTGSYKLDGVLRACEARATVPTFPGSNGQNTEYLDVELLTTPQPAGGAEKLVLHFVKPASGGYQLFYSELYTGGSTTQFYLFRSNLITPSPVTAVDNGKFSGTFMSSIEVTSGTVTPPYSSITEGKFTDVKP